MGNTGILVVWLMISLMSGVAFHNGRGVLVVRSFVASLVANAIFQVLGFFVQGHLDPFWPVALVVGGIGSFLIALVVQGLLSRLGNRKHDDTSAGEVQNTPPMTSSAAGDGKEDGKTKDDGESDGDEGK